MSDDFPYTDEQVETFGRVIYGQPWEHADRKYLRRLHEAGITVQFPQPRYRVEWSDTGRSWRVFDKWGSHIASFYGYEELARAFIYRLNSENREASA